MTMDLNMSCAGSWISFSLFGNGVVIEPQAARECRKDFRDQSLKHFGYQALLLAVGIILDCTV